MPYCTVANCSNSSQKVCRSKGGVSFHFYPSDPNIKKKWIEATGKKNWFPTKHSTICSSHFRAIDFNATNKCRRLFPNAFPSVDVWKKDDRKSKSELIQDDDNLDTENSASEDEKPQESKEINSDSDQNSSDNTSIEDNAVKLTEKTAKTHLEKRLQIKVARLENRLKLQAAKVKRMREQNRRANNKIDGLQATLNGVICKTKDNVSISKAHNSEESRNNTNAYQEDAIKSESDTSDSDSSNLTLEERYKTLRSKVRSLKKRHKEEVSSLLQKNRVLKQKNNRLSGVLKMLEIQLELETKKSKCS